MDWRMKKQLLEKYWKGETNLEEEQWLKKHAASFDKENSKEEANYLQQLGAFSDLSLEEEFDMTFIEEQTPQKAKVSRLPFYWNLPRIAAAVFVLITLSVATYQLMDQNESLVNNQANAQRQLSEAEEAFEIAKQSLLLISANLNKGVTYTNELEKFNQVHEKIKSKTLVTTKN